MTTELRSALEAVAAIGDTEGTHLDCEPDGCFKAHAVRRLRRAVAESDDAELIAAGMTEREIERYRTDRVR